MKQLQEAYAVIGQEMEAEDLDAGAAFHPADARRACAFLLPTRMSHSLPRRER